MQCNTPAVFQFDTHQVREITIDGEPWFVAADVCSVLEITNNRNATARIDDDDKGVCLMDTLSGKQNMTIVNESGLYSLILRSDKPEAKRFKKWVTSEVLPTIRKTGGFNAQSLNDPSFLRSQLLTYSEKVIEMQPKALAFDMLMSTKNSMTMGEAAKSLGWGRNMLFSLLRTDRVLMSDNVPYQEYIDRDYFRVKVVTVQIGDKTEMKSQTLVTAKGLNWLAQSNVEHMQARKTLLARKSNQ